MRVFLSVASFSSAYGGPARSVSCLASALADVGIAVGVWAPDQSALTTDYLDRDDRVQRLSGSEVEALAQFGEVDVIHDNGIWLPHNHRLAGLARARNIPRVVSTRGMLDPWALNHKRWKKRLAWWLYQNRDLRAAAALHATATSEADPIRRHGFDCPVHVIPNGVHIPGESAPSATAAGPMTALFVGRIYPVKGLPMLIEAWSKVRPAGWKMRIVGPDEAGHRAEVEALVRKVGLDEEFEFSGPLEGDALHQAYRDADLFILPSHTENFGMAAAEALAHALPVIATNGTPWKGLLEHGCGWWPAISSAGLAQALEDATSIDTMELRLMGARGRQWMLQEFSWPHVASGMVALYRSLRAG